MRLVLVIGVLSGALLSSGCSLVFVRKAPPRVADVPPSKPLRCTSGKAAPVIDTLVTGYQLFRTGYALSASDSDYSRAPIKREADIGIGIGLSALFLGSAIYGYSATSRCSEAEKEHEARAQDLQPRHREATPAYSPPGFSEPPPYAPPPPGPPAPATDPAPQPVAPGTTESAEGSAPPGVTPPPPSTAPSSAPAPAPPAGAPNDVPF